MAVCATVAAVSVVAAITSVTLAHGDAGQLIRNLGLVAAFLVAQAPVLINQIRARDKVAEIAKTTTQIKAAVNGTTTEGQDSGKV